VCSCMWTLREYLLMTVCCMYSGGHSLCRRLHSSQHRASTFRRAGITTWSLAIHSRLKDEHDVKARLGFAQA
jgi:hypothetical protein